MRQLNSSEWRTGLVKVPHTLGLVPIAEGVEHEIQAEALVDLGCDLGQGFHLGRPLGALETRALLVSVASPSVDRSEAGLQPVGTAVSTPG